MATYTLYSANSYQGRKLRLYCTSTINIADNTSTISWTLYSEGGSSNYYTTGPTTVNINGVEVYYKGQVGWNQKIFPAAKGSVSGSLTVSHNSDGKKSISVSLSTAIYTSTVTTNSGTWTLDDIPRYATITSATNFTDIQNPTITYSNQAGNNATSLQACISLTGSNDDIAYRDIPKTGTSYTFNLTEAERNVLRQATSTSNTRTVYFYVKTVISGNTFYQNKAATFSIVDAFPTFNVAYLDTNSTTTAITGNNQQIIQNKSTLQINITNAAALKYATLTSASVNVNGTVTTQSISGSSLTLNIGTVDVANNLTVPVKITDSRGNSRTINLNVQVLAWSLPNAIITLNRLNNYYDTTNLTVDANYSSLDNKNTITIQYQIKKVSDASYGSLTTIQDNVQTQFTADNTYEWNVKVILTDRLGTTSYILTLGKGIPIVYFDNTLNSTGFNCFPLTAEGVWSNNFPIDDVIYLGSQVLYDSYQMTTSGKNAVLGSYNYDLINGLFTGITLPSAYERAYRVTAQMHTQNNNQASIWLNNFQSNLINTWSNNTMRKIGSTRIFKESEITLETTYGYSKQGTNLYCSNNGNYQANFWNITVHCYLVKKTTNLEQVVSYELTNDDNSDIEEA